MNSDPKPRLAERTARASRADLERLLEFARLERTIARIPNSGSVFAHHVVIALQHQQCFWRKLLKETFVLGRYQHVIWARQCQIARNLYPLLRQEIIDTSRLRNSRKASR